MIDGEVPASIPRLKAEECRVEARSERLARFACSHEAPARYAMFIRNAHEEMELIVEDSHPKFLERCGDCRLADVIRTATRCVSCSFVILVGQQVAEDSRGLRCLADGCAGPFGFSGHWDGTRVEPAKFSMFGPMM